MEDLELTKVVNNIDSQDVKVEEKVCEKKSKAGSVFSAKELLESEDEEKDCLWGPFIDMDEVVAISGSSDVGKSSFLRQLAISIVRKKKEFLGYPLNVKYGRAVYVSTEDGKRAITRALKKQLKGIDLNEVENLHYIFNDENTLRQIEGELKSTKTDAVFVDCFTDVFTGAINDIVSIKKFLKPYKRLCEKYGCVIFFLHHNGKRTESLGASKNNMIGSMGFEGTMRTVMDLRKGEGDLRQLWFTKGNYLPEKYKKEGIELMFDDKQEFSPTGKSIALAMASKKFDEANKVSIIEKARKLKEKGLTLDKILQEFKKSGMEKVPSKASLCTWLNENKKNTDTNSVQSE